MSSSRLHNQHQAIDPQEANQKHSENQQELSNNPHIKNKSPGRPRGRGRPKLSLNIINKKKSQEEAFQEQIPKPKEKIVQLKEENQIEGYIRIVDYLKKIQCDEVSFQNKMNPFHALTASCFWYMVSAEYFSCDFFTRNNPTQASLNIVNKVMKLPVQIPLRIIKNVHTGKILEFQTQQIRQIGKQLSQKMAHLIPGGMSISKAQNYQKRLNLTSVSEDDQFISSTRALLFNYVKDKIRNNQKWNENLNPLLQSQFSLEPKLFLKCPPINLQQKLEQPEDIKSLDELTRQNKKKKSKSSKPMVESQQSIKQAQIEEDCENNQNSIMQKNQLNQIKEELIEQIDVNGKIKSSNERIVSDSQSNQHENKRVVRVQDVEMQEMQEISQNLHNNEPIKQCESNPQKHQKYADKINQQMEIQNGNQREGVSNSKIGEVQNNQQNNQIQDSDHKNTFQKKYTTDEILLSSLLQLPLEKVILMLQSKLSVPQLPMIQQSFMPISKSDPLDFIFNLHEEQQNYLEYMKQYKKKVYRQKKKQSQTKFDQQFRQDQFQDAKCQICTDGDYTDDNLIVFCSTCNISLHQRCVGLAKVPAQSWVCDVCLAFGPAGINVPCPLCNVQGGALKRTNIHIDSTLFKQTNPGYYQFSKKCPYSKQKQEYLSIQKMQGLKQGEQIVDQNLNQITIENKAQQKYQKQIQIQEQHQQIQGNFKNNNNKDNVQNQELLISQNLSIMRYSQQQQQNLHIIDKPIIVEPLKLKKFSQIQPQKQQKQQLYYDYFNRSTYPQDQPACHYVWVHYVCAIWIPECYFQEKNGTINIKGIQNIQKKRFKHTCFICRKSKGGACVKCQDADCDKYYHPECARKKKVYMEQLHLQKIKYLIFCQQHEPLKITRQIQYKKKKNREEIIKFARMIQKYVETYKIANFPFKLLKINPGKSFIQTNDRQQKEDSISVKPEVQKQTDQQFIKDIILKLSKAKKIIIKLQKTNEGMKIEEIQQPTRREFRKCLNRYDDFWHTLTNGESVEQNFKRFQRITKQNIFLKETMETFLNGGPVSLSNTGKIKQQKLIKKGKVRGRSANVSKETMIEEGTFIQLQKEGGIFCICRKPYENQVDMLECEVCSEWYHFKCIGFMGNQDDAQNVVFHCMKCMKFQTQQQKNPRLQKCKEYFSPDSLYLNYRPPTPQLLSQEQDNQQEKQQMKQTLKQIKKIEQQKVNKIKEQQQHKKNEKARKSELKLNQKSETKKQKQSVSKSLKLSNTTKQNHKNTLKNFISVSKQPVEKLVQNLKNFKVEKKDP